MRALGAIGTSNRFRVKGHTIAPKPGGGDVNAPLWLNWPWSDWIKPQIDAAAALGANTFVIKGPPDATVLGETDVRGKYRQLIEYCGSIGRYVYVSAGNGATGTVAAYAASLATIAGYVHPYPNVIGLDMWNEINVFNIPTVTTVGATVEQIRNVVKAVTDIPVTVSVANFPQNGIDYMAAVAPYCDFLDFHPYADNVNNPVDLSFWRGQSWWKPFIIGEFGVTRTNTTNQAATYNHMKNYLQQADCYGAIAFCIASYTTAPADQYGMYDETMASPLVSETAAFAAWPTYL